MTTDTVPSGPHAAIATRTRKERFTLNLLDALWDQYRGRVSYAATYEIVVQQHGGTFVNDHIAFRTLASQRPTTGIIVLSRLFEALGYQAAGCYQFPDKHLNAIHFQHPHPQFPKLFISELRLWELEPVVRQPLHRLLETHRPLLDESLLASLDQLDSQPDGDSDSCLQAAVDWIQRLPWQVPEWPDVELVNRTSQYAAWVMVHGYNVNHFTSLINSHGVPALDDIEKTVAALASAGVPMKSEIEGQRGSKLRQSATEAVVIDVPVRDGEHIIMRPWTYAYFELAERGTVPHPDTGQPVRFEGFLGPQATQLFEMTRVKQ